MDNLLTLLAAAGCTLHHGRGGGGRHHAQLSVDVLSRCLIRTAFAGQTAGAGVRGLAVEDGDIRCRHAPRCHATFVGAGCGEAAVMSTVLDPWNALRSLTAARIAQGHAGVSMPTAPQLAFQLAHAQARDAVHVALDVGTLAGSLPAPSLLVRSMAADRQSYLRRPRPGTAAGRCFARFVGSASRRLRFVRGAGRRLVGAGDRAARGGVRFHAAGRAACAARRAAGDRRAGAGGAGDDIAVALGAQLVVVLIGERPVSVRRIAWGCI